MHGWRVEKKWLFVASGRDSGARDATLDMLFDVLRPSGPVKDVTGLGRHAGVAGMSKVQNLQSLVDHGRWYAHTAVIQEKKRARDAETVL
jgi:hypothetical protein